jgi:uncharacterized RDD family membrane protein YckC
VDKIVRFETPENIAVEYRLAGPGTRFIAYVVDSFLVLLLILLIAAILVGILGIVAYAGTILPSSDIAPGTIIAGITLVLGFTFYGYFPICEFFMNGQTPGKRLTKIRVVSDQGFSLGVSAIIIRNLIKIPESMIPLLWIVPLITERWQRLGDLAAATIVVKEDVPAYLAIRAHLAGRNVNELEFQLQPAHLGRLRPIDVYAVENYLARRTQLPPEQRTNLVMRITRGLAVRMDVPQPLTPVDQERFLEDLVTCHARQEVRELV